MGASKSFSVLMAEMAEIIPVTTVWVDIRSGFLMKNSIVSTPTTINDMSIENECLQTF